MLNTITAFDGDYAFLSNMYLCPLFYKGMAFASSEHAYQAEKFTDFDQKLIIQCASSPYRAKRLGRMMTIRPDWDQVKVQVMREILDVKFSLPDLADKLLSTGNAQLVEGNNWNDTFWGVCNGKGQNWLGKLLMEKRAKLKFERNMG